MRFVITGTPRSATGYAAVLFSAANVPTTHEVVCRPRTSLPDLLQWYGGDGERGESSWLAWVFLAAFPGKVPVLHTVRNPWAVVDSLAYRNDLVQARAPIDKGRRLMRDIIQAYCPRVFGYSSDVDRAAAFCIDWNRAIESATATLALPYLRYRVEDITARRLFRLIDWLGIYRDEIEIEQAVRETPRNVNAGKRLTHSLEIVDPEVRRAIKKVAPEQEPVVSTMITTDTRRSPEELEAEMDSALRRELNELAERYGYSKETSVPSNGESKNGTLEQCATV